MAMTEREKIALQIFHMETEPRSEPLVGLSRLVIQLH
jgi:hypothetical protein